MRSVQADPYDEALARIVELTSRLHAVADLHAPRRSVFRGRVCRSCGRPSPCPTVEVSRRGCA